METSNKIENQPSGGAGGGLAIGPVILKMEDLRAQVDHLKLLLQGATQPENIGHYHQSLKEKQEELSQLGKQLKDLRQIELNRLRTRAIALATEMDGMDSHQLKEEETEAHLRELQNKIESLNKIIANEHP